MHNHKEDYIHPEALIQLIKENYNCLITSLGYDEKNVDCRNNISYKDIYELFQKMGYKFINSISEEEFKKYFDKAIYG